MQAVRNEISRNLHDDIGSSLTNINILNELTQRNMQDKEKVKGYINKSGEIIQRINESLSDIVWNINPKYDNLSNLLARMKWYASELMDGKNIQAEINFPDNGHDLVMPMEQRRDFYLVFKELVNNLAKHSHATAATIQIQINNRVIELLVKDNGSGFDMPSVKRGNGLESMKQRAARWSAVLDCKTQPGQGTEYLLVMKF
jgi:signal transduction histidine kinase